MALYILEEAERPLPVTTGSKFLVKNITKLLELSCNKIKVVSSLATFSAVCEQSVKVILYTLDPLWAPQN